MAAISHAAGPEWAYLTALTRSTGTTTDLDSLFFNVIIERAKPDSIIETKVLNLQTLIIKHDQRYGPHDVTRFCFARFRRLTGTGDLDLFFYEGSTKNGVAISDEPAFQRLLLAVHHLGLGAPSSPSEHVSAPPVLKFYARPKPPGKIHRLKAAFLGALRLLGVGFICLILVQVGIGWLVFGAIFIYFLAEEKKTRPVKGYVSIDYWGRGLTGS
ncbi:hypothetical protein DHEL01_v202856 [Diaporthe helianthi]|uniref:Uncharacterized protein n=1 Tax=Diaporthe helianthi TaxID=158607 RepID=A0A2P5I8D7_DIAHE|nr:hypothetical protein DHEL01_v202856 [Diaporthe helianthi]